MPSHDLHTYFWRPDMGYTVPLRAHELLCLACHRAAHLEPAHYEDQGTAIYLNCRPHPVLTSGATPRWVSPRIDMQPSRSLDVTSHTAIYWPLLITQWCIRNHP